MPDQLTALLENQWVTNLAAAVIGALFWNWVAFSRGRVRVLEYTVTHERVAIATEDAVFGNVAVTWQGMPMDNLFLSTITLENTTSSNFSEMTFRAYTGDETFLLNERREIVGSPYYVRHSDAYADHIRIPAGQQPTDQQRQFYWHQREYTVPVVNRKQKLSLSYLTSVLDSNTTPTVWLSTQHQGAELRYRPNVPMVFGVPVTYATWLGFTVCVLIASVVVWSGVPTGVAASVALIVGLTTQAIGAGLYRFGRFVYRIILH